MLHALHGSRLRLLRDDGRHAGLLLLLKEGLSPEA
jgi:hypothetical protein